MAGGAHWAQNDPLRHFQKIRRSRLNRSFTTTALWKGYSLPGRPKGGNSPPFSHPPQGRSAGRSPNTHTDGYSRPSFGWGGFRFVRTGIHLREGLREGETILTQRIWHNRLQKI